MLSPRIAADEFPGARPTSIEDRIRVFEDRVIGWQLGPAAQLMAENEHAGFAVVHIVTSYFEMVGMAVLGKRIASTAQSKRRRQRKKHQQRLTRASSEYFEAGVLDVFPELAAQRKRHVRWFVSALWRDTRCRLYHEGITGPGVFLSGNPHAPYQFVDVAHGSHALILNPQRLVAHLHQHFQTFIVMLRNPSNTSLRHNFKWLFDQVPR